MDILITHLRALLEARKDRLEEYARDGAQAEPWIRRRMLELFENLKTQNVIADYEDECERETCGGDLDFVITLTDHSRLAIELKALLVGEQRIRKPKPGRKPVTDWRADHYFVPDTIGRDLAKLRSWRGGRRFLLTVMYRNPGADGWRAAVAKAKKHFAEYNLIASGSPEEYPEEFFIGLHEVPLGATSGGSAMPTSRVG